MYAETNEHGSFSAIYRTESKQNYVPRLPNVSLTTDERRLSRMPERALYANCFSRAYTEKLWARLHETTLLVISKPLSSKCVLLKPKYKYKEIVRRGNDIKDVTFSRTVNAAKLCISVGTRYRVCDNYCILFVKCLGVPNATFFQTVLPKTACLANDLYN